MGHRAEWQSRPKCGLTETMSAFRRELNEHMGEAVGGGFLQAESWQSLPLAPFFTELSSFLGVPHGHLAVVEAVGLAISRPILTVPW